MKSTTGNFKSIAPIAFFAGFVFSIFAANWALGRWGFVSIGFGMTAPAGVYFAGLTFGLRDALHELVGRWWVLAAIICGGLVSAVIEPQFALASAAAFTFSETVDLSVYEPLRERQWGVAVVLSNVAGSITDSLLFLWLAFGSIEGWLDLTVGKVYMVIPALVLVARAKRAVLR